MGRYCGICLGPMEPSIYGGLVHVHEHNDDHQPVLERDHECEEHEVEHSVGPTYGGNITIITSCEACGRVLRSQIDSIL